MIQHPALDRMKYAGGLAGLRYKVEPSACRQVTFTRHLKDVSRDGIAAAEAVKQPAVQIRLFESLLYRFDQGCLRWICWIRDTTVNEFSFYRLHSPASTLARSGVRLSGIPTS